MPSVQELYEAGKKGSRAIFECAVIETDMPDNAIYDPILRTITINAEIDDEERLLALAHELAHIFQCAPSVLYPDETDDKEKLIRDMVSEVAAYRALMRFDVDMTSHSFPRLCEYITHYILDLEGKLPAELPGTSDVQRGVDFLQRMIAIADGQVNGHTYPPLDPRFTRTLRITTNFVYYIFMLYQGVPYG